MSLADLWFVLFVILMLLFIGFGATFRRMWEFSLAYCEAGFRSSYLDVAQLTLERPAAGGL